MKNKIKEFKNFGDGYALALKTAIEEIEKKTNEYEERYKECDRSNHPMRQRLFAKIGVLEEIIGKLNSLQQQPKPKEEKKP